MRDQEPLVMAFIEGPYSGAYEVTGLLSWPLPEKVRAKHYPEGSYRKNFESTGEPGPGEARGARYEWVLKPYQED